jgi:ArsR family transcriptional regulator, arsenate/arsenite/antimonite-responsive transcriptional repressor
MGNCCHGKNIINFFKAVCDSNRHQILHMLKKNQEMNATDIVKHLNLSQPTVSHHIKILVEAGVLDAKKQGKEVFYSINKNFVNNCCRGFADDFCGKK